MKGYMPVDDYRTLRFATFNRPWPKLRAELPHRVTDLAVLEDFTDPTGWSGQAAVIPETGEAARSITSKNAVPVWLNKLYDTPLIVRKNVAFPVFLSSSHLSSIRVRLASDAAFTSYFDVMVPAQHFRTPGTAWVVLNRSQFTQVGTPSWDAIRYVRFIVTASSSGSLTMAVGRIETYDTPGLCTLWFDDGHSTQFTEAFSRMNALKMPGTISIPGQLIGGASMLTRDQLREIIAGGWDVVNHTWTHENLTTVPVDRAEYSISKGLEYLLAIGAGRSAFHMVAPQGGRNAAIDGLIRRYAISHRCRAGADNCLPVVDPYALAVREVTNAVSVDTVKEWIDSAAANGTWLILLFHYLMEPANTSIRYSPTDFQAIIDYLDAQKASIPVMTVSEALVRV